MNFGHSKVRWQRWGPVEVSGWGSAGIGSCFCSNRDLSGNKHWPPTSFPSKTSQLKKGGQGLGQCIGSQGLGMCSLLQRTLGSDCLWKHQGQKPVLFFLCFFLWWSGTWELLHLPVSGFLLLCSSQQLRQCWTSCHPGYYNPHIHPFIYPSKMYWELGIQS